jgi:hypothetical protein
LTDYCIQSNNPEPQFVAYRAQKELFQRGIDLLITDGGNKIFLLGVYFPMAWESRIRIAGFALILILFLFAVIKFGLVQLPNDETMSAPDLALTVVVSNSRIHGLPQTITIKIRNISSRDLLIPEPHQDCSDGMYGSLFFRMNVRTTGVAPILGRGCATDYNFSRISIEDRVRVWKRLAPG